LCCLSKKVLKSISVLLDDRIWEDPDENFPQIIFEIIQDIVKDRLQRFNLSRKPDSKQILIEKFLPKFIFVIKA